MNLRSRIEVRFNWLDWAYLQLGIHAKRCLWLVLLVCACSGSAFRAGSGVAGSTARTEQDAAASVGGADATGGTSTLGTSPTGGTVGTTVDAGELPSTGGAPSTSFGGSSAGIWSGGASTITSTGGVQSITGGASALATGGQATTGGQSNVGLPTGGSSLTGGSSGTDDPGRCPCAYTGQCNPRFAGCWTSEPGSPYKCVKSPLMCGANPTAQGAIYCYEC